MRRSKRKVYVCDECKREFPKHEGKCPICGAWNSLSERTRTDSKGDKRARKVAEEVTLPPEAQAAIEVLLENIRMPRKRVTQAVAQLLAPRPGGFGLSVQQLVYVANHTMERHRQSPMENPIAYMVTLGKQPQKIPTPPEESWRPLTHLREVLSSGDQLGQEAAAGKAEGERCSVLSAPAAAPDTSFEAALANVSSLISLDRKAIAKLGRAAASLGRAAVDDTMQHRVQHVDDCTVCGGAKVVITRRIGVIDDEWGEQETAACPACNVETKEERRDRFLRLSGIEGPMSEMTLDSLEGVPGLPSVLVKVQEFLDGVVNQLVLVGGPGQGKTHLAVGAMIACIDAGLSAVYLNTPRFLDALRNSFGGNGNGEYSRMMVAPMTLDMCVLDDLGGERRTEWAQEQLFEIVDTRYAKKLKTIACSNYPLSVWEPRLVSRLADSRRSHVVELTMADYRLRVRT